MAQPLNIEDLDLRKDEDFKKFALDVLYPRIAAMRKHYIETVSELTGKEARLLQLELFKIENSLDKLFG